MSRISRASAQELLETALLASPKQVNVTAGSDADLLDADADKTPVVASGVLTAAGTAIAEIRDTDDKVLATYHLVAGQPVYINAPIVGTAGKGINVRAQTGNVAAVLNIADDVKLDGQGD